MAYIYADAPVMGIKSWPMGKGKSLVAELDTQKLLVAYGFESEKKALEWKHNPLDHAACIADVGIPVLHVVGDEDDVVR